MESFKELFEMVKEYTRQYVIDSHELSEIAYQVWIKSLEPVSFDGNTAVLFIKAEFMKKIVEEKYLGLLNRSFEAVVGFPVQIEIRCETSGQSNRSEGTASVQTSSASPVLPSYSQEEIDMNSQGGEYEYTFSTFIVGSSNKFAQAACRAVAQNPANAYNPLFIYGGSGLGKTHLLYAIAAEIKENRPNTNVIYVKGEEFTNELIETIRNGNNSAMTKFREKYRNIDVLLVDDIQFIIGKESTQEEFFHTFNSLHSAKKQIIISSDKPPKDMEILEERFRSRFEWGLIADITLPDYETRMAILHKKEEMDGYDINEEVIKYIANNIKSNIRELEGAINKVMAFAKLEKKEVTLELAEQALKDIISPDEKKVISLEYIISMVAEHFDVTVDDLCGNKRNSKIVTPRQIAMYLCREIISTPLKSIGKCLGNRDHTTIMHGIDKIEKEINNDENLKNTIETLKKKINPQG